MSLTHLPIGFLPLLDAAIPVIAREKGFAADEGLDLQLIRETSWANIRDRIAVGHFDAAHMLAPMPIAAALGLTPLDVPIVAPFVLGLGNNAITVSGALWAKMAVAGAPGDLAAGPAGAALASVVQGSSRRLRFAVVHQTSSHNYELRYWLAASGIRPDADVEIVVLPPRLLPDAIAAGTIDGYCVGEPWNSIGVDRAGAHLATVKASIWRSSPDKVLGVRTAWAAEQPETVAALIRALDAAAQWCGDAANHAETAAIMARPDYLDAAPELVLRALAGRLDTGGGRVVASADFFVPFAGAANLPQARHALWYYSQMVRWGQATASAENAARAADAFRPDLYRAALPGLEGGVAAVDAFFDGTPFDPDDLGGYIASQRT